jgi:hypothetical protein
MIRLLVCSSYVQVCGRPYKQEKGIPVVFKENYFLLYCECNFMQRLAGIVVAPCWMTCLWLRTCLGMDLLLLGRQFVLLSVWLH